MIPFEWGGSELRDELAMVVFKAAMEEAPSQFWKLEPATRKLVLHEITKVSYEAADAMMEARDAR